ncbi:MAG: hypothetical protein KC416_07960 [Myxococcales bacterium]|nr:hypothetical protein [Myxococcales bacterium]
MAPPLHNRSRSGLARDRSEGETMGVLEKNCWILSLLVALTWAPLAYAQGGDPNDPEPIEEDDPRDEDIPEAKVTPKANNLVEAETTYRGALILRGGESFEDPDTDISMGSVSVGSSGDKNAQIVGRFIGNTLNAEAKDDNGNNVLFNAEFYWFESSIDRGSDFFVAVVKAVNSPNRAEKWVLEHSASGPTDIIRPDHGPVLQLRAETDPQLNNGGFRFDWSIPKDDYGIEEVGSVQMNAVYGVGLKGEGSAQYAYTQDYEQSEYCEPYQSDDPSSMAYGCKVGAGTQLNGNVDLGYSVNTNYQIKLFTWDVYSDLSPTTMLWTMFLRNKTEESNKAYHEYFITMQTPEDEEFVIDSLELIGHFKKKKFGPWPDDRRSLSVVVKDIHFRRPKDALTRVRNDDQDTGRKTDTSDGGTRYDYEDTEFDTPTAEPAACAVRGAGQGQGGASWTLGLLGLALLVLRRRTRG